MILLMVAGLDSCILNLLKHTKLVSKTVLCYKLVIFSMMHHFQSMYLAVSDLTSYIAGLFLEKTLSIWRVVEYDVGFFWKEKILCLPSGNWYSFSFSFSVLPLQSNQHKSCLLFLQTFLYKPPLSYLWRVSLLKWCICCLQYFFTEPDL